MNIDIFLQILPVFIPALISPGPDFIAVSTISVSYGRLAGIQGAIGIATGIMIYSSLSLLGLSVLLSQTFLLAVATKIAGGIYLCYISVVLWHTTFYEIDETLKGHFALENGKTAYKICLLTSLTNPKAMAFFTSIFTLVITPDTNTVTKFTIAGFCAVLALCWFSFVALVLSTPIIRIRYQLARKIVNRIASSIMMLFGLKLLFIG